MKLLLTLSCFLLFVFHGFAQIKAVTTNGDEVILNPDGTWKYVNDSVEKNNVIDTNKTVFTKAGNASFLVKSSKTNCGIYLDPKKWSFKKTDGDKASEFSFNLKNKDAYAMLISEKMEVPFETLKMAALENAKKAAPDIKVTKQEYRKVNNNIVLLLQMDGTIQGMKFTYFGYYFSSPAGTNQLLTYTSSNLLTEYRKELEEFLNGFVTISE
jgi:hypothetical protein